MAVRLSEAREREATKGVYAGCGDKGKQLGSLLGGGPGGRVLEAETEGRVPNGAPVVQAIISGRNEDREEGRS